MKTKASTISGENLKQILVERSLDALETARKDLLSERISSDTYAALEFYAKGWKEITHPGLMSLACEAVECDPREVLDMQVVMLLFSAAVDVHDDLIDYSRKKNGKSTLFGKFGRNMSILVGDAFMVKAFSLLETHLEGLAPKIRREILTEIKRALFTTGDGHVNELKFKRRWNADPEQYLKVLESKGAIVEAEMKIGAILGKARQGEIDALGQYGRIFGTLGTLREEFVDMFDLEEFKNRIHHECLPIPIMYALKDARARERIKPLISGMKTQQDAWNVIDIISRTSNVKELKERMEEKIEEAQTVISCLKNSHAKTTLISLASSMTEDL